MKVAVFGDSFAAPKHDSKTDAGLKSWVDYLSEKHDVTNYAIEGSSLYYSVRQFMTFNYPYDKIIFVTTAPGRLYLSDNPILEEHGHTHLSSLSYAEFVYNENKNKTDPASIEITKTAQAVIQYFTYIQRTKYDKFIHELQIDHIKKIRPDVIIVPAFRVLHQVKSLSPCLYDITEMENAHWGIPLNYGDPADTRRCHMSKENNLILAGLAEQWLQGEPVNINISNFVIPVDDKSFYNIK